MSTDKIRAQAVSLWEELTGKSVGSSSYSFRVGGESFDLYQANKRVKHVSINHSNRGIPHEQLRHSAVDRARIP